MEKNPGFRVGYGRADITPTESVPLHGYGNTSARMSQRVLDPLCATCVAFTDAEGETALLFTLDLVGTPDQWPDTFLPAISAATGVAEDHIFASAIHTHSAPDYGNKEKESIRHWLDMAGERFIAAAAEAMDDRKSAEMFTATVQTSGLNFVRRYILQDGTPAGDNYGHFDQSPIARHETEPDRAMRLVKFVREGGPDVILANFQVHPHRTGGAKKYDISADIVGAMRAEIEQQTGCRFAYFTGGAGNINPKSRIEEENVYFDHISHGKAMAAAAMGAEGAYVPAKTGRIRTAWKTVTQPTDHSWDSRLADAEYIQRGFYASNDRPTWHAEARKLGFNSVYHAGAVLRQCKRPAAVDVPLCAFAIGDVGFALAPYEMFDTNAAQIRDGSPFPMTFVLSCATMASFSYIPSALGFQNGGYSTDSCWFLPGTGEQFADTLDECLKEVRG